GHRHHRHHPLGGAARDPAPDQGAVSIASEGDGPPGLPSLGPDLRHGFQGRCGLGAGGLPQGAARARPDPLHRGSPGGGGPARPLLRQARQDPARAPGRDQLRGLRARPPHAAGDRPPASRVWLAGQHHHGARQRGDPQACGGDRHRHLHPSARLGPYRGGGRHAGRGGDRRRRLHPADRHLAEARPHPIEGDGGRASGLPAERSEAPGPGPGGDLLMRRYLWLAWGTLAYNLGVIAWGAYVRATGSGAGCGSHWPLCNGEVIPRSPTAETLIEFSHRVTSGLALLLVVVMVVWARRLFPKGHPARLGAWLSLGVMVLEALLGAGLVLFGLVADDDSVARAVVMGLHLVNTLVLLGARTLAAWWASGGRPFRVGGHAGMGLLFGIGVLGR